MGFGCGGGSTCKAALKKFEESTGSRAAECPEIRLIGVSYRGIMLGYHIWVSYLGIILGYHIGVSYLGIITGDHIGVSYWGII